MAWRTPGRTRTMNPTQMRGYYYAQYGSSWSLTGSLLGSTLLYMGLYLLVATAGAYVTLVSGFDNVMASSGSVAWLPMILVVFLLSAALNRAIGNVKKELLLGGLMMLVVSPFLGLAVAYGLTVSPAAVGSAVLSVAGSLVVTAAIAYVSPWDLSKLSGLAFVGLMGLIITQVLAMFIGGAMGLVTSPIWAFIGILVFELYMVVDLSRMKQAMAYGPNDGLAAYLGLGLALDVVNLFMYFLMLFVGGAAGRRQ
jgi:FtsH-binding integral membrane protein